MYKKVWYTWKVKVLRIKAVFTVLLPLHCWIYKSPKFPVNQEEVMLFDVGVKWICMFDGKANNNLLWFFFLHTIVSALEKPLLAGYVLVSMMFSSPKCWGTFKFSFQHITDCNSEAFMLDTFIISLVVPSLTLLKIVNKSAVGSNLIVFRTIYMYGCHWGVSCQTKCSSCLTPNSG